MSVNLVQGSEGTSSSSTLNNEWQQSRWDVLIERYLNGSDLVWNTLGIASSQIKHSVTTEDFRDIRKSFVLRVTLCGIVATMLMLMISCQTMPRRAPFPRPVADSVPMDSKTDSLYVRRETARIIPRVPETQSGSIYAATQRPLDLFSDETAAQAGDYVHVMIPESLQFRPPTPSKLANNSQSKASQERAKDPEAALIDALSKDISGLSLSNGNTAPSPSSIKMEIVGVDNGTIFLRGTKTFEAGAQQPTLRDRTSPPQGHEASLMITAQVKQTAIKGKSVDATELSQVEVVRIDGGRSGSYRSDGWDVAVSRHLTNYTPDVDADLENLRQYEGTLSEQQKYLTERLRALRQEQNRFKKEQARMADKRKGPATDGSSLANSGATANTGATPNSSAPEAGVAERATSNASAPGGANP